MLENISWEKFLANPNKQSVINHGDIIEDWAAASLSLIALQDSVTLNKIDTSGVCDAGIDLFLAKLLEFLGGTCVQKTHSVTSSCIKTFIVVWPQGYLSVEEEFKRAIARGWFIDEQLFKGAYELINEFVKKSSKKSVVQMLSNTPDGFTLSRVGVGGIAFNKLNYADDIVAGFNKIIADLKSSAPSGRLSILHGPPGTGKSYFLRGLMDAVPGLTYVIVPPQLISELMGPSLIPALIRAKNHGSGPIVLILEDADSCLVSRQADNMSDIATVLNFSDGIIGSVLDVRIIATTNAKKVEIDKALKRNGRLSSELHIDFLSVDKSKSILDKLIPNIECELPWENSKEGVPLSDVYAFARQKGWVPPKAEALNEEGDDSDFPGDF